MKEFISSIPFIGFSYVRLCLILLLLEGCIGYGQAFKWQGRFDISLVQDNNVFETTGSSQADSLGSKTDNSVRMGVYLTTVVTSSKHHKFHISYNGGIEGYRRFNSENRIIQHGSFIYCWRAFKHIALGAEAHARDRLFFQTTRGYQWMKGALFTMITLPCGFRVRGYSSLSNMNYKGTDLFDFQSRTDGVKFIWQCSPGFQVFSNYQTELMKFNRPAYGWDYPTVDGRFLPKDERQKNLIRNLSFGIEGMCWMLFRIEADYQWQFSNSYGYDYERPCIEFIAAKSLPWTLTLRAYAKYQNKKYADSLEPFQISPYTENEENTRVLCDLIKDLAVGCSLRLRIGWYLNESPFRNLYYEKTLISIGFSRTF
ncbi:hypothetical protein JW835_01975 [bacterium]|nr:hypothetical protein [bacterium]